MKSYQIRIILLINLCLFGILGAYLYRISNQIGTLRHIEPEVVLHQNLSDEQYAGLLIQMGQLDQASALVRTFPDETKNQLMSAIEMMKEKQGRGLDLILELSQYQEQIQQQSSWGWVKFEKVEVVPTDMRLQHALQMAFISTNMGFLGWDKVTPVLQSCADAYPQQSETHRQLKQLIITPEGEQDV